MSHRLVARTLAVIVFVVGAAVFAATAIWVVTGSLGMPPVAKWAFFAYCSVCAFGCSIAGAVAAIGPEKPVSQEEVDAA